MRAGLLTAVGLALLAAGCAESEAGARPPALGVVDSAVPIADALERFRGGLTAPTGLKGDIRSREELVARFVRALERRDTAALRPLALDPAEFAWLYYPASPMSRPPYELPPDIMWLQMQGQSERGASLLLAERAGAPLGDVGHGCESERMEEKNRIYGHCVLRRVTAAGDTVGERLFGLIMERDGIYKFVSFANKLD